MAVRIPDMAIRNYLGHEVHSTAGPLLGHVVDILADARSGTAQWVVVSLRGFLPRHRALPCALVLRTAGGLGVPVSRRTLRDSPQIRLGTAMTARQELDLHAYWIGH
ncbi:PRC-barrel domain-containing protein [Janibacter alittae]|uniref:PRC-barrel domain-containing protein n=1 Tax=Janibacter alittae TaxID=3115209 RepID=A0ABZ2MLU4_9MICO